MESNTLPPVVTASLIIAIFSLSITGEEQHSASRPDHKANTPTLSRLRGWWLVVVDDDEEEEVEATRWSLVTGV